MVHFGPSDYSLSIGKPGQGNSTEVKKQYRSVIETAIKKGIRPRVVIDNPEQASEYIDMGVRDFCIGNDLGVLYNWYRASGEKIREVLK